MITFQLLIPIRISGGYSHKLLDEVEFADDNIYHIILEAKRLLKGNKDAIEIHINGRGDQRFFFSMDRSGQIVYGETF